MEYDAEIYKLLFAWLVSYSIIAPIIVIVNYVLSFYFGTRTVYGMHPSVSPIMIMASEITYMTIAFVKTMWVYKNVLKKGKYYPETYDEFRDFILIYAGIHLLIDIVWTVTVNVVSSKINFLNFLRNYSNELGIYSLVRPVIVGIALIMLTKVVMKGLGDLEAIGTVMFSLFLVIIASF